MQAVGDSTPHAEVFVRVAGAGEEEAVALLAFDYLRWAAGRLLEDYGVEWPAIDLDQVREGTRALRETGVVLVAEMSGTKVGIGAVHLLPDGAAEIKRMYVHPDARGRDVGSRLVDGLLREARSLGAGVVRLDTVRFMTNAQRLYRSRGFAERDAYAGTEIPPSLQQHWLFFERSLDG